MKLLQPLTLAFSMYSKLPMPKQHWEKSHMSYVFCFFPMVGLVMGGGFLLWWKLAQWLALGPELTAAGCVLIPLLLTGGIHMDGFCDTTDALSSHQNRERKLEILKDSNVGAFAVMGCVCYLLVQYAAWCQIGAGRVNIWCLAVIFVLSRTLSGLGVVTQKNARGTGMLATFTDALTGTKVKWVLVGWLGLCVGMLLWLDVYTGGVILISSGCTVLFCLHTSKKQFGGITGDLAGWFLQLCELICLLGVALTSHVR